jgi:hypothetical protein
MPAWWCGGVLSMKSFHGVGVRARWIYTGLSEFGVKNEIQMKRIAGFTLLLALSVPWSIPVNAQRIGVAEGQRRSRKANKKQQKMNKKSAKKQQKAMKKAAKAQRKANKKANRSYR